MDYKKQAEDFLQSTATTLEIIEAVPQKSPLWTKKNEKHGIHYSITLKNARHSYTFDYWDSIAKKEKLELAEEAINRGYESSHAHALRDWFIEKKINITYMRYRGEKEIIKAVKDYIKPTAYDILACLSPLYEDNFEDFCSSMGYDSDSITAEKTYNACIEQDRNLRKLFTHSEIDSLAEIV